MHPVAAVQPEYSLWTRNVELGVIDTCKELGIALVAFSPIGRGSLAGTLRDHLHARGQGLEDQDAALRCRQLAQEPGADRPLRPIWRARRACCPVQLALRWILAQGDFCHAIPGTTDIDHLEQNFAALAVDIDPR